MKRETMKALETRRNSVMAERRKSQMQTLGANHDYVGLNNNGGFPGRNHRSSTTSSIRDMFNNTAGGGGVINNAYEGTISEDEMERNSMQLENRQPHVVFRQ